MKKILVTRRLLKSNEERISKLWNAKLNSNDKIYSKSELVKLSQDCDGILTSILDTIDEKIIIQFSDKTKIISNFAVGFGNIDIEAARKRNIIVTNTPDFLLGKQLTGSKLGILGMGRIGRAVAKRAKAFGMKIHYHNRKRLNSELENGATYHKSIQSLFSVSEVLSINCPATKETQKKINRKTLKFFPKESVIVNSARGDMVDDDAMVEALKNKSIFALGLDVYNGEPKIHSGYLNHPNVFILPHLGSSTIKTRTDMADLAINNIEEFLKKGDCINRVN